MRERPGAEHVDCRGVEWTSAAESGDVSRIRGVPRISSIFAPCCEQPPRQT
jgi:hypothetical protein